MTLIDYVILKQVDLFLILQKYFVECIQFSLQKKYVNDTVRMVMINSPTE